MVARVIDFEELDKYWGTEETEILSFDSHTERVVLLHVTGNPLELARLCLRPFRDHAFLVLLVPAGPAWDDVRNNESVTLLDNVLFPVCLATTYSKSI